MFLRTLGDFKIPAVVERRRKELLVRLEDAQGDTRREKPRKLEEAAAEQEKEKEKEAVDTPPVIKRAKQNEKEKSKKGEDVDSDRSRSSSTVTSPSRRDSKAVNSLVSGFEVIHATAKKEEEEQKPKKWQVELRKTKKPVDFPAEERKSGEPEPEKTETIEDSTEASLKPPPENEGSTLSLDSSGNNEPDASATPKTKKSTKLNVFRKLRGKSPVPSRKDSSAAKEPDESAETSIDKTEPEAEAPEAPEVAVEEEEGVRMSGKLEYKVKTRLSSKFVSKDVKLKDTTLHIGDKDTVSMVGCTVHATDHGFELFSHTTQKNHTFKVADETKEKWVTSLQAAIDEVTPKEEGILCCVRKPH